jgi:peptide/nickel transport system substrate-binding protein
MKTFLQKAIKLTLCITMGLLLLTGCRGNEKETDTNANKEVKETDTNQASNPLDDSAMLPGIENDLTMVVEGEVDTSKTLTTLIDCDASPAFNGNPYDEAAGLNWSVQPFIYDYLTYYTPYPERTFKPSLLESYEYENNVLTMKLLPDLKWSDGTVLDATDVMTSSYIAVGRSTMWNYIDIIEQIDNLTIRISFCTESPLVLNVTLSGPIMTPDEIYGKWAEKYREIAENYRTYDESITMYKFTAEGNEKLAALNEEFLSYKPAPNEVVCSGQYVIDKYNNSEIYFIPNENYRKTPLIGSIRGLRPGNSQAFSTALMAEAYTIENGGLNVDMSEQIDKKYEKTLRKIFIPELSSIGYALNTNIYPLNIPEVRKAISCATDRNILISIAEPGSFLGDTTNSPMLPSLINTYTTDGFINTLENYTYDVQKAEEMLTSIGWAKQGNMWVDENGESPVISIATINSWPSFMMTAEAMSSMLTDFGFNIDFKPMEFGVWNEFTKSDEKMVYCAFLAGASSYAHPWEIYKDLFTSVRAGWPEVKPGEDRILVAPSTGKEYNITNMLNELYTETDPEKTKKLTEEFMILANDLCGYIPVIEKAAPLRIYDTKLSLADTKLNTVQQNYYYFGNINTIIAKLLLDDQIYFVK